MSLQVKCEDLSKDVVERLEGIYKEKFEELSRVGEAGYLLPARYKAHAALVRAMPVRADDVWVLTFPRSGTHMTAEMIWLLQNNLDYKKALEVPFSERNIFIETFSLQVGDVPIGYQVLASRPSPRVISSHLALSLLPPLLDTAKAVFVARDPRDVAVSYYNFYKKLKGFGRYDEFQQFWQLFTEDLVVFTPFFPLLKEAWAQKSHPNMLFIFYEDIIKDMSAAIRRISKFLGKEYSEEEIATLCGHMDINNMRKNASIQGSDGKVFVRQGKAGGWRDYFDDELRGHAERWMGQHLAGTDLQFPDHQ